MKQLRIALAISVLCVAAMAGGCLQRPMAPELHYDGDEVQKLKEEISNYEI